MRTIARLEEKLEWSQQQIQHKNEIISDLADKIAILQIESKKNATLAQQDRASVL